MTRGRWRLPGATRVAVAVVVLLSVAGSVAAGVVARRAAGAGAPFVPPVAVTLGGSVSAGTVTYGAPVTVTGALVDPSGVPVAGRVVEVLAVRGDVVADPIVVGAPVTDARGRVAVTFRPEAGTSVWLRFAGELGRAVDGRDKAGDAVGGGAAAGDPAPVAPRWLTPAISPALHIAVAPRVRVSGRTRAARTGWVTYLRGTVIPAPLPAAQTAAVVAPVAAPPAVRVERLVRGHWQRVGAARLGAGGTFAATVRDWRQGLHVYRLYRPGAGAFQAGSGSYRVRTGRGRPVVAAALPHVAVGPGQLLVTGDSLAYFLGQQLAAARGHQPTAIDSRPSSGLARPDYFDWTAYARTQVATGRPRGVVAFVGANDCQPLHSAATGTWAAVGTPAWATEYRRRAAALMRVYATVGVAAPNVATAGGDGPAKPAIRPVVWVGLPIARKPDILACYRMLNSATAAAARTVPGVTWVDSWSVYAVDGHYSDYVQGVLARQHDGIHITYDGTRLLTRKVLALLR